MKLLHPELLRLGADPCAGADHSGCFWSRQVGRFRLSFRRGESSAHRAAPVCASLPNLSARSA
jgi:hypothetical protein